MSPANKEQRITLTLAQKGLVLVGLPLIFQIAFVCFLAGLLSQSEHASREISLTKSLISRSNTLTKLLIETGGALSSYSADRSPSSAEHYQSAAEQIPVEIEELKELCHEIKGKEIVISEIEKLIQECLELARVTKKGIDEGKTPDWAPQFKTLQNKTEALEKLLSTGLEAERKNLRSEQDIEERQRNLIYSALWIGCSLNVLLSILMAQLFYTGITGRLMILTDNAIRLARNEALNPLIAGTDEVAYLDRIFHEMAQALDSAARKERSIIENAVDVICSIDENGKFTAVSPASVQVWGYQPEELIGHRFTDLILAEDIEYTIDCTRKIMLEHALLPFENRVLRKNGALVHILWSAYWSNTEKSMFCVAHDISDRKRAEDLLKESELRTRSIIESMPVGLIIVSDQGKIELVNPQMEKMFEMPTEELLELHLSKLFPKAEEFKSENFRAGAYQRLIGRVREFSALRKGGELFHAELTFIIFNTAEGSKLLVNILDVTERHSMERLKREFVTTVSHELRTPLTAIRGSLTLLSVGALGPMAEQAMKAVKIAERNALRLVNLINDLLDIEKLEAGKMEMVFEKVLLSTVFERSIETVRPLADQYEIELKFQMDHELELCADGDRLVQVLINLLSNAVKFSPRNDIILILAEELAGEDSIKVTIKDNGRGIPAETLPRIFERFQQVEAADAKRKGGSGLGLAICKAIIEQHNGQIGADSQAGKGSSFWFSLPKYGSSSAPSACERIEDLEVSPGFEQLKESDNESRADRIA